MWALIQSFSLAKNEIFSSKGFSFDFPVNVTTNKVDWNSYRLSLARMQSIANHSTHLRATCNFPTDGLQYTDYARAKLAGHDIFGNWSLGRCQLYEYINIRGINCSDCTARTKNDGRHKSWAINSYNNFGCQFDGRPGAKQGESSFGQYKEGNINSNHSCTSSAASTTQHWFGVKHDL